MPARILSRLRRGRRYGLSSLLGALILSVLAPVLLLAAGFAAWNLSMLDEKVEAGLNDTARALSLAVDREVQTVEALLTGLASSPYLDSGDLHRFHQQAARLATGYGGWVVLTDPSARMVVNTLRRFSEPLPTSGAPEIIREVFSSGRTVVTNLFMGRVARTHAIAVIIPVVRDGRVIYTLDMAFVPARLSDLLAQQNLPHDTTAALLDRDDVIIGRSRDADSHVGATAPRWLIDGMRGRDTGVVRGTLGDGEHVVGAFQRSGKTGWTTTVRAPAIVYERPMQQAAAVLAAGGLGSLVLATAAALLVGRRIVLPLRMLAEQAQPIVRGESALPTPPVREVAIVQEALIAAADVWRQSIDARFRLLEEREARIAAEKAAEEIRKRERALRESEERYRGLTQAIASIVWTTDADGSVTDIPQWRALTGQSVAECAGWGWIAALHPDDVAPTRRAWQQAVESRAPYDTEYRVRIRDGGYRWYKACGVPVFDHAGRVREWVGVCIDIHERKTAEERQALLMAELDHRVRNILASVQSMVALSAGSAPRKDELARRQQGRVTAMARTHGLLTRERWTGASLTSIIGDELRPYADGDEAVTLAGPDCVLRPRDALNFALVVHELATNAAKYGALSVPGGRVHVDWRIAEAEQETRLVLEWRESAGPEVRPPTRRGFGSSLLESVLGRPPDASVALHFNPGGVRCHIELRLATGCRPGPKAVDGEASPAASEAGHVAVPARVAPQRHVLVAEDEPVAALEIAQLLREMGFAVAGPAATVAEAAALVRRRRLAGAVLDITLNGEMIFPVADRLAARGVPLLFVSGSHVSAALPERFRPARSLQKPFDRAELASSLRALTGAPPRRELR